MNTKILDAFLSEDGDAQARHKLLDTIREHKSPHATIQKYAFNRFNVTLDFEAKKVLLEDDLTVNPQGEYKLGMEEFEKALQERK